MTKKRESTKEPMNTFTKYNYSSDKKSVINVQCHKKPKIIEASKKTQTKSKHIHLSD